MLNQIELDGVKVNRLKKEEVKVALGMIVLLCGIIAFLSVITYEIFQLSSAMIPTALTLFFNIVVTFVLIVLALAKIVSYGTLYGLVGIYIFIMAMVFLMI